MERKDGGVHLLPIYIYMYCARSIKKTHVVYSYASHLSSIVNLKNLSSSPVLFMLCLTESLLVLHTKDLTRVSNEIDLVYWYARHLCLIDGGVYPPPIDMHCTRSSN